MEYILHYPFRIRWNSELVTTAVGQVSSGPPQPGLAPGVNGDDPKNEKLRKKSFGAPQTTRCPGSSEPPDPPPPLLTALGVVRDPADQGASQLHKRLNILLLMTLAQCLNVISDG